MIVRTATLKDIPQLCGLLALLFEQEAEFAPDADLQACGLRLILEQPDSGIVFCAAEGESIVGMVSLLFTASAAEGGRVAWLEDMIVHPDWRGRGIGERLLHEAIRGARTAECKRITLLTDSTNTPAMAFYARAGFTASPLVPFRLNF